MACHTDHVSPGGVFVAINGTKQKGIEYVSEALKRGARTIILEATSHEQKKALAFEIQQRLERLGVSYDYALEFTDNARKELACASARVLGYPARSLKIVAVTGTKGKSTSVFILRHILKQAGYKTALLSTVKNYILDYELKTELTTQQPDYLQVFFDQCVKVGVEYVVMETAAQAFSLHRVEGLHFIGAIFTNISQEHAEFYPDQRDYFEAKKQIIKYLSPGAPLIINGDDERVCTLRELYPHCAMFSVNNPLYADASAGVGTDIPVSAEVVKNDLSGLRLLIRAYGTEYESEIPALVGSFNASNVLGCVALLLKLGITQAALVQGLRSFERVPGRLEKILLSNGATAFIDYAHNPSSFKALFQALRPLTNHLVVLFGAGGERDATKRPVMGALAASYADQVVISSDNPRSEDPAVIAQDILAGIAAVDRKKVVIELDRERALTIAYDLSGPESMILLLGKGPDEYQLVKGVKLFFSEAQILRALPKKTTFTTLKTTEMSN